MYSQISPPSPYPLSIDDYDVMKPMPMSIPPKKSMSMGVSVLLLMSGMK